MLVGGRRKVSDSSKMDVSKLDTFSCDSYLNGQESKREGADTHPWREVLSRTKREGGERIPPPNPYALQISKTVPVQVKKERTIYG